MQAERAQFGPDGRRSLWRTRVFSAGLATFYTGVRLLRLHRRGRRNALDIQLVTQSISLSDLPRSFDGYRILHLSDTHLDCLPELATVASRLLAGIEVDLLVLTGDIHGHHRTPLSASVYDLLFRTAAETLLTIAADPKHLGARIGLTAVLHTWGSALAASATTGYWPAPAARPTSRAPGN